MYKKISIISVIFMTLICAGAFTLNVFASIEEVTFPVVELGNCESKEACFAYCEETDHIGECTDFAEKHGIISKEDAEMARKYPDIVKQGGPGGCDSVASCEAHCEDLSNIGQCVAFAEKHGLLAGAELAEAKQVMTALQQGAELPGGCQDSRECKMYCEDATHVGECLTFAEAAGMMSTEEIAEARQVLPYIEKGETPGQCTTKLECENYCADDSKVSECVNFAEKVGFMSAEEAEMARKTGGKGPGDCSSEEECSTYCNKSDNQRECFDFAKEHDLVSPEELAQIEDGIGRLRSGLDQAPEQVSVCLQEKFGEKVVREIAQGTVLPNPEMGEVMEGCFAGFVDEMQNKLEKALGEASPETLVCIDEKVGQGNIDKIRAGEPPTPETGDAIRVCFEAQFEAGMARFLEGLETMPDEAKECLEKKVGATVKQMQSGKANELIGPETERYVQECIDDLVAKVMAQIKEQAPIEVHDCLMEKYEAGMRERMMSGEIRGPEDIKPEIKECFEKMAIPSEAQGGSSGQGGAIPADFQPDEQMCAQFKMAPSCDYVPDNVRSLCEKCQQ